MKIYDILRTVFPHAPKARLQLYAPVIETSALAYNISTKLRFSAWLSQLGVESNELQWMEELASGAAYEGRKDLGNVHKGDGVKYKGHGPIQITGFFNHQAYTNFLEAKEHLPFVDFVLYPKRLTQLPYSIDSAAWFFAVHISANPLADTRKILAISIRVNGVNKKTRLPNGWDRRKAYYEQALRVIPDGWTIGQHTSQPIAHPPIHSEEVVPDEQSTDIPEYVPENDPNIAENNAEVVTPAPTPETLPDAIYSATNTVSAGVVLRKERPSTFSKWSAAIKLFFGGIITTVSAWMSGTTIQEQLTTKVIDGADGGIFYKILPVLIYSILGIGGGILLMWIASVFYDRSANRSNKLNTQKMAIAACPTETTVEINDGETTPPKDG